MTPDAPVCRLRAHFGWVEFAVARVPVDLSHVPPNMRDVAVSMARSRVLREVSEVVGDDVESMRASTRADVLAAVYDALRAWRGCEFAVAVDDALAEG